MSWLVAVGRWFFVRRHHMCRCISSFLFAAYFFVAQIAWCSIGCFSGCRSTFPRFPKHVRYLEPNPSSSETNPRSSFFRKDCGFETCNSELLDDGVDRFAWPRRWTSINSRLSFLNRGNGTDKQIIDPSCIISTEE